MTTIPNLEVQVQDGSFALRADDAYRVTLVLAAGIETRVTVPVDDESGKRPNSVFFASEASFFATYTPAGEADVTAAIPVTDVTDGTGIDINPTTRSAIRGISEIGLISRVDQLITLSFYQ